MMIFVVGPVFGSPNGCKDQLFFIHDTPNQWRIIDTCSAVQAITQIRTHKRHLPQSSDDHSEPERQVACEQCHKASVVGPNGVHDASPRHMFESIFSPHFLRAYLCSTVCSELNSEWVNPVNNSSQNPPLFRKKTTSLVYLGLQLLSLTQMNISIEPFFFTADGLYPNSTVYGRTDHRVHFGEVRANTRWSSSTPREDHDWIPSLG